MLTGVCQIDLFLPESDSLKAKRFVLKSIKTRLRNKFNVSVAETDHTEKWQRSVLAVAVVSNSQKIIDQTISGVLRLIEQDSRIEIVEHLREIF
jgi:uncharacterized protein YlxP (DUF503 family)